MPRLLRNKQERVYVEFRDRQGVLRNVDSALGTVYDSSGNVVVDANSQQILNRAMRPNRTGVYSLALQFAAGQTLGLFYMWAEGAIDGDTITQDFPVEIELKAANFIPTQTLCSMTYLKNILRIDTTEEDTYLYDNLLAADTRVKEYCRLSFWENTYTEYQSGEGGTDIMLDEVPITAISSITDDGSLIDSDDYTWNADGYVQLLEDSEFSDVRNGVCAIYTAGWAAIPDDIQIATARLVGYWRFMEGRGGLRSERVADDYTFTRDTESLKDGLPVEVRNILKAYRNFG